MVDLINIYGDWINQNIKIKNTPFNYIIINNFLNDNFYNEIIKTLPNKIDENFWEYSNPIEVKYVLDKKEKYSEKLNILIKELSKDYFIDKLKRIFLIDNIEADETLHGSGLHYHPKYGRLNMHLDYEKHPILENKQRKLNIIIYLNNEWEKDWEGATELWNNDMSNCVVKCYPSKNKAIIFETSELSWHGVPEKIMCPENIYRKTLALYYITPLKNKPEKNKLGSNNDGYRTKAVFIKRPQDKDDERMEKLYKIRPYRRITKEDMKEIWPEWTIKS
jgi:Rps23 Pro-64 3,4-dihydroxylase Tpa1-like proline 4-hydroxylase|tara:strand:- start:1863 stop:2693 length:831 start_codon:yes stop_codon:yes gene_type:complete